MKYIVLLGDGMADLPIPELGNKTPLQAANKPAMDFLAQNGTMGMVKTVPDGIPPGSDAANLSVFGYDPKKYYTGRSPIEAVSMGINLSPTDVAVRCNLVTLSSDSISSDRDDKTIIDYSADEITTEEAKILIEAVAAQLNDNEVTFHPGISYRHCMVWNNGTTGLGLTPPHDILDRVIAGYLPKNEKLLRLMRDSYEILKNHPVNLRRKENGLHTADSIWLWGEGTRLSVPSYRDKYNLTGSVISAVDLLKGIGICAGLDVIDIPGATGNIHTNYEGKMNAALNELKSGKDFVYIHIEAPDECGHRHEIENKVLSIELIDQKILKPLLDGLTFDDYKILLMPDHPTPLSLRTHTSDPVPFVIYDSRDSAGRARCPQRAVYDEEHAAKTGIYVAEGHKLMDLFLGTV
ncbi:MAG: cofactor-independent phosphoglycerate mutase [Oscillospiraceae bacterium]|nr:cofactor-independent phosphoglycerate mutase [Oscillospiraceae bacterium]